MFTLLLNCMHVSSVSISAWCDSVWSLFGGNTRAIVRQWQWSTVRFNLTAESINIPTTKKKLAPANQMNLRDCWTFATEPVVCRRSVWCKHQRCAVQTYVRRLQLLSVLGLKLPCFILTLVSAPRCPSSNDAHCQEVKWAFGKPAKTFPCWGSLTFCLW